MTSIVPFNGFFAMSKSSKGNLNEKNFVKNTIKQIESERSELDRNSNNNKQKYKNLLLENDLIYIDEEDGFHENRSSDSSSPLPSSIKDQKISSSSNINKLKSKFTSNNSINLSSKKTSDTNTKPTTTTLLQGVSNQSQTQVPKVSTNDSNSILKQPTKDYGMSSRIIDISTDNQKHQQQQQQQRLQQQQLQLQQQKYDQMYKKGKFVVGAVDIAKDHLRCGIRNPIKNQLSQIHCNKSCVDDHDTSCCQPNKAAKINDSVAVASSSSSLIAKQAGIDHFDECGPTSRRIKRCSQSICCANAKQYSHNHHHHHNITSSGINECSKENDLEKNLQSSIHKDDDNNDDQECISEEKVLEKEEEEECTSRYRNPPISTTSPPLTLPTHSAISTKKSQDISEVSYDVSSSIVHRNRQEIDNNKFINKEKENITKNIQRSVENYYQQQQVQQQQLLKSSSSSLSTGGVKSQFDNNNSISTKIMCGGTSTTTKVKTETEKELNSNKINKNCDTLPPISNGGNNLEKISDKRGDSANNVNNLKINSISIHENDNKNINSSVNNNNEICDKNLNNTSAICKNQMSNNNQQTTPEVVAVASKVESSKDDAVVIPSLLNEDDDEGDDPYYELQEYLERVKREINEVFEQYKLKNDELPTSCTTNIDSNNTSNNKLFVHKTPCFLNGTNSEKKLIEISNSNNSNNINNNSISKESERSASSTTSTTTMPTTSTIIATNAINVASNSSIPQKIIPGPGVVSATSSSSTTTTTASASANINSTPMTSITTRSSKITECNYKKHALELQPEDNQLQPQQLRLQIDNIGKGSNATEIADDIDGHGGTTSASGMRMRLDINKKDTNDVKIWANTILKELDNLMGSDKQTSGVRSEKDRIVIENYNWTHLKPEKRTTIPLQSFSLDHSLTESLSPYHDVKKDTIDSARRSLIFLANSLNTNNNISSCKDQICDKVKPEDKDNVTILKIEEDTTGGSKPENGKSQQSLATDNVQTKKEILQQASFLQNDTNIKKGSTSTIWTSEESILRSVGAADEDNKSTSSSACDEASALLSSVKSDNSSVSSGIDNENNESGIGTATPPKGETDLYRGTQLKNTILQDNNNAIDYYQNQILDKMKLHKSNSIISSSDDPDLLEVLSQFEGINEDDEISLNQSYDIDFNIDNDSTTITSNINNNNNNNNDNDVILRNKNSINNLLERNYKLGISYPNRTRKGRSHSIETVPFPTVQNGYELFHDTFDKTSQKKNLFCLPLHQEPFQNSTSFSIRELPSPSSASLHSGNGALVMQELSIKSNSAPILLKKEKHKDTFGGQQNSLRYSRSQSDRYLAEIEAIEACKWLRAAGFPQYAQMYEDLQFPIDLSNVAKDHPMLENDPLQSLYRRLCILNRCATMRLDNTHKQHGPQKDESDDEGFTLSENWTFQPQSRRWSRVGETGLEIPTKRTQQDKTDCSSKDSSPERFDDDSIHDGSEDQNFPNFVLRSDTPQPDSGGDPTAVRLRRTGSERLKDGAKALLRRVESIKSRRRKRQNREGLVISGPQMLNLPQFNQRISEMKCVDVTAFSNPPSPSPTSPVKIFPRAPLLGNELKVPTEHDKIFNPNLLSPKRSATSPRAVHSTRTSPLHFFTATMPHLREGKSDDSSSYYSDSQESTSGGNVVTMKRLSSRSRRFLQRSGKVDDIGAHSDSECHQGRKMILKDGSTSSEIKVKKLTRGGSLNFGKESKRYREAFHSRSFRSRTSYRKEQKPSESDKEEGKSRSHVVRWHSFRSNESPEILFKKCLVSKRTKSHVDGTPFSSMSCGQLQIIRKLALVTLTGYMERYCPTHRSGWNWELPKFIKKIKTPDYKDKKVFGVPLLLVLQRTGHSLPAPIRGALKWLHINALDQIGLFRKSGVKSRISKLKERIESSDTDDCMEIYDNQQAYDVADMLKQYFRDLPDCLLTTKMSETFVAIFQHLPCDVRADAIQSAVLLLPDEHREVLYSLLKFLSEVADNSQYNQMTANNLAVCLAPSLFYNSISSGNRSTSASPRRRKPTGIPDVKELSETKASHECLTFMILNFKQIFTASRDKIIRCNFGYMEESRPVPLEALGEGMPFHNWRGYLYECTSATIKEGREKSRGWISITSLDTNVEIAYKKVGDGHPLRLWRCITEIEAPPHEVLSYILKERNSWDVDLLKCRTVQKLDDHSEVFQYACDGQTITDYCVLRSWQPDLPRKACVIVETSVDHPDASLLFGGVRGVVLASRYLIEPCGSGKSRLMHLARVDAKGKTPEWYNKCYGHICSHYLTNIRSAFRQITDGGPESKV